ncbi:uncharacterized protein LOC119692178 [Plutella xylostella]|uniref:uncharacterized protein LOC119692178 n=1 Tax=Plutella xylostella TaxID=51655 RepID=UPI00203300BC|nr:uncharacterized protein LOC119692178 [Plutella xylostella]
MWTKSRLILLIFAGIAYSLIIIPERAVVTYVNTKHLAWANSSVKKYDRKSPYYLNIEGENVVVLDETFLFNAVVYQYVSNEYRRTFVEFHMSFCKFLKDPYFGGIFLKYGLKCPIIPGIYHFMNMTFPTENFPQVWPFEKCLFNMTMTINGTLTATMYISAKFISKPARRT